LKESFNKYKSIIISAILLIIIVGLYFSRAMISIGTGLLGFIALVDFQKDKLNKLLKSPYLIYLFTYLLYLLSFFYTQNFSVLKQLLFLQLPFIIFPFFFSQQEISKKQIDYILKAFIIITSLVCLGTLISFFNNYTLNMQMIINAKAIPAITGIVHYQFAFLIVIAIICSYTLIQNIEEKSKPLWLFLLIFLIATIHILAYRTGVFCFYILVFYYFIKLLITVKNKGRVLGFGIAFLIIVILSFLFIKPLNLKIAATNSDISRIINHENYNDHSIAQRYAATLNSLQIIKNNFWLGVAPADLGDEMKSQYKINSYLLIPENRVFVHNQYLYYLSSFGILAFVIWVFLWFKNLFISIKKYQFLAYLILLASAAFLIDDFFQIQIGFTGFLFFYYLLYQRESVDVL
jgi:O-antigen ligase